MFSNTFQRASQIRSMPFTGDSSDDSSDGEEPHSMSVTAQNTPHHTYSKFNQIFSLPSFFELYIIII